VDKHHPLKILPASQTTDPSARPAKFPRVVLLVIMILTSKSGAVRNLQIRNGVILPPNIWSQKSRTISMALSQQRSLVNGRKSTMKRSRTRSKTYNQRRRPFGILKRLKTRDRRGKTRKRGFGRNGKIRLRKARWSARSCVEDRKRKPA
jgi:hypothetical protein